MPRASKFEVFVDNDGRYRWELKSPTGDTIANGGPYPTKTALLRGINRVRQAAVRAEVVEVGDET
jgi:hypothetical protein